MSDTSTIPPIVQAAHSQNLVEAALAYQQLGLSVLPLTGKRPNLPAWVDYQSQRASQVTIYTWNVAKLFQNVGLVCGAISNNLVVLDMDGAAGYPAFVATFPHLTETYTVASGGGVGKHVYWQVDELPASLKAMATPIGNLELCANGRQVVAVPSIHPTTKNCYTVHKPLAILRVATLQEVVSWIESFKSKSTSAALPPQPARHLPPSLGETKLNSRVVAALEQHFSSQGYKLMGDWLHGPCVFPHRHQHGDQHPSFGFNRVSGYGFCHVCGTLLAKDLCEAVGINPVLWGGLVEKAPALPHSAVNLADAPQSDTSSVIANASTRSSVEPPPNEVLPAAALSHLAVNLADTPNATTPPVVANPSTPLSAISSANEAPPDLPAGNLDLASLELPRWLCEYLDWAGATGNQTPLSFHLCAGLWLAATAIGRRLYAEAPWGQTIYPNMYMLIVAVSTFYRKSTAYRLAEEVGQRSFAHLLLPTPGSPERLLNSLSGVLPANFKDLPPQEQESLRKSRPFAAQRALHIDEISGLLSAVNRKDYMSGMKDHLLEIYDCPSRLTRDTQVGLTIVYRPSLSILGLTTPAALTSAVAERDWLDGLFPRFLLITPEKNYLERPAQPKKLPIPPYVISGLHQLYAKLPEPPDTFEETADIEASPKQPPTPEWAVAVEVWAACRAYGERLRQCCDPTKDNEVDERLRPVYGRLHVQALKIALLLAALRWIDQATARPTITPNDWAIAEYLAEYLRASAHELVEQLERNGEASREQNTQDRMIAAFQQGGPLGRKLRDVYRQLHLPAKLARQMANDLVLAGLLLQIPIDGAEGFTAYVSPPTTAS